jgi:hypothetical protein
MDMDTLFFLLFQNLEAGIYNVLMKQLEGASELERVNVL